MTTTVGSTVHPWYKGTNEWKVTGLAELQQPMEWKEFDPNRGNIRYAPKILSLHNTEIGKVLWFNYWMSTFKTNEKMRCGEGPPMLEEGVFLELIKDGIQKGLFSKSFLKKLDNEIQSSLGRLLA